MSWKPSKRQAQLKKRLVKSHQVYLETSHILDQMLLKMLHSNHVYTPDDFYNKYIKVDQRNQDDDSEAYGSKPSLDRILDDLDRVLRQLKQVVDDQH